MSNVTNKQESSSRVVPLTTLRPGDVARVQERDMTCDDCELLNAMGLTDRCELKVCRLGEPCIVQVSTTRLGLSRSLASRILVQRSTNA